MCFTNLDFKVHFVGTAFSELKRTFLTLNVLRKIFLTLTLEDIKTVTANHRVGHLAHDLGENNIYSYFFVIYYNDKVCLNYL